MGRLKIQDALFVSPKAASDLAASDSWRPASDSELCDGYFKGDRVYVVRHWNRFADERKYGATDRRVFVATSLRTTVEELLGGG